mgnify:FL=1|tara:strand:+ start:1881 stop:2735 length:855 start_codon:yes stop_codon:yes gene_type:complete
MSTGLSTAFIQLFDAEVKQAYQGSAVLNNVCRMRTGVVGSTANFPNVGKGQATVRTPQTDVTPLNTSFGTTSVSLTDYNASEYSDVFNQQKVNFDERRELASVVGNAIGRRQDQVIIDALSSASAGTTIANTVVTTGSASASDLNVGKILSAKKALDAKNVPPTDRHLVIHANNLSALLGDERAISGDYQNIRALVAGQINSFLGFTVHMIGDRDEGGLAIDGSSDRICYAFHKMSVACAVGIAPKTEVNYIPEKTSFLVTSMLSMGASVIDTDGLVDVTCRES